MSVEEFICCPIQDTIAGGLASLSHMMLMLEPLSTLTESSIGGDLKVSFIANVIEAWSETSNNVHSGDTRAKLTINITIYYPDINV